MNSIKPWTVNPSINNSSCTKDNHSKSFVPERNLPANPPWTISTLKTIWSQLSSRWVSGWLDLSKTLSLTSQATLGVKRGCIYQGYYLGNNSLEENLIALRGIEYSMSLRYWASAVRVIPDRSHCQGYKYPTRIMAAIGEKGFQRMLMRRITRRLPFDSDETC